MDEIGRVSVDDDGKGFDIEEKLEQKSLGLQSIKSRVKFLDGSISMESSPGKGTFYTLSIPLGWVFNFWKSCYQKT